MAKTALREDKVGRKFGPVRWPIDRVSARDDDRGGVVPGAREAMMLPGGASDRSEAFHDRTSDTCLVAVRTLEAPVV